MNKLFVVTFIFLAVCLTPAAVTASNIDQTSEIALRGEMRGPAFRGPVVREPVVRDPILRDEVIAPPVIEEADPTDILEPNGDMPPVAPE